jgi:hypothetical protein
VTTPLVQDTQLTIPYVTVPAFKAHPTYLDLSDLRSGDNVLADQDEELFNILMIASADVDRYCMQPIQAHVRTENKRLYADRRGRLFFNPDHGPARLLQSYSYATTLGTTTSIGTPQHIIENNGYQIIVELAGSSLAWSGSLQFSSPAAGQELYTTCTYVPGYANAVIVGAPTQGATSITVSNPTGIFAGDTLRIWEPGKEESVVVAATWAGQNTVPFTSAAIPLVSGLAFAHVAGAGVTGFNSDVFLATVYYAVDALQRWGTQDAKFPGTSMRASLGEDTDMSEWEMKAERRLLNYRRVR